MCLETRKRREVRRRRTALHRDRKAAHGRANDDAGAQDVHRTHQKAAPDHHHLRRGGRCSPPGGRRHLLLLLQARQSKQRKVENALEGGIR